MNQRGLNSDPKATEIQPWSSNPRLVAGSNTEFVSVADRKKARSLYIGARLRCTNPADKAYRYYGGRGIKFLFTSQEQFFAALGPRPSPRHSVDRINNDGNYEPGNVRWATPAQQSHNHRTKPNKTGITGVYLRRLKNGDRRYFTLISVNNKSKYLGSFRTLAEGAKAREEAKEAFWCKESLSQQIPNEVKQ